MTERALVEYGRPTAEDLPPGWWLNGWNVVWSAPYGSSGPHRLHVYASFEHADGRGAEAEWTFYFGDPRPSFEWLRHALLAVETMPPETELRGRGPYRDQPWYLNHPRIP